MMVGAAFIPLNNRCGRRETAQQAEIRLADFLTILPVACTKWRKFSKIHGLIEMNLIFCGIYLIPGNRLLCYPDHSLRAKIGAVSSPEGRDEDQESTDAVLYT
jgi:hypothetical protein